MVLDLRRVSRGARLGPRIELKLLCHSGLDVDLVFVETAVNDEYTDQSLNDAEDLLRSILQLPTDPAVVYVDAFALRTKSGRGGMLNGGDGHAPLSAYYDVPQISLRGPVLPSLLMNKELAEPYFKGRSLLLLF